MVFPANLNDRGCRVWSCCSHSASCRAIVEINPVECIIGTGFPAGDSFQAVSTARFEDKETVFLL